MDNGRALGFDNAHNGHHRHYMGSIEPAEYVSYEATLEKFQREWLERMGLIISQRQSNPGHGIGKLVKPVAAKIEMVAILG